MIFWLVIVPVTIFYVAGFLAERRLQRECRKVIEEFLNRDE